MTRVAWVEKLPVSAWKGSNGKVRTVSHEVSNLERWSSALLPPKYRLFSSLFLPATIKLSELAVFFMSDPPNNPFWSLVIAAGNGVALL